MEQRGVTEVSVRATLERATAFEPSVVEGRFMIHVARNNRPWIVIVEPDNAAVRDQLANAERVAKAIQDKLDRLDEAFLFERSIDIETYDRHAEKLREELTLARIDRHSGQLEELDVEGILAFANAFCHAPPICGCRRHSNSGNGSNNCSFQTESRSTEKALLEPA